MNKHTPGPWSVSCIRTRESGEPVLQILAADEKPYAMVFYSGKTSADHAASYADANLIAAAPDMLVALEMVAHDVRSGSLPTNIQNAIERALAKAEGHSQPIAAAS